MKTQPLKVFFCNIFLIVLLVAPVLAIVGTLVGLGLFAFADYPETARWICGISFGTSIFFMPIAFKIFSKPHAHAPLVISSTNDVTTQTMDKKALSKERRALSRYQHNCSAIFANELISGFATICDISQKGCRLRSNLSVRPGDSGQILVDVPGIQALMTISLGVVRWVRGSESGIEFIAIQDEERFLQWLVEIAQSAEIHPTREYSANRTANR